MKVGLIDVDGHNFPNLALMKLSAWHKSQGDNVEWWIGNLIHYDIVYKSKVFDDTYSRDTYDVYNADSVICGGTGYDLKNKLPEEIEHIYPDYGLYGITDTAYGYLTRGCPRGCSFNKISTSAAPAIPAAPAPWRRPPDRPPWPWRRRGCPAAQCGPSGPPWPRGPRPHRAT